MSLVCPNCGHSGEWVRFVPDVGMGGPYEDRRCRNCGHEYTVEIDIDDDPYPPDFPDYPPGGPTCPNCHSTKTQNQGAASDGDGDLYDDYHCSDCGENFPMNKTWIDDEGNRYTDEDDYHAWGIFNNDEEEEVQDFDSHQEHNPLVE